MSLNRYRMMSDEELVEHTAGLSKADDLARVLAERLGSLIDSADATVADLKTRLSKYEPV